MGGGTNGIGGRMSLVLNMWSRYSLDVEAMPLEVIGVV